MLLEISDVLEKFLEVLKNNQSVLLTKKKKQKTTKPNFDQVYRQAFAMTQLNFNCLE